MHGEDKLNPRVTAELRILRLGLFPYRNSSWNGEYVDYVARDEINNNSDILPLARSATLQTGIN